MGITPGLLRYWRKQRGLSQRELADRTGLSQSVISKYENGNSLYGIPSEVLEELVEKLGMTMGGFYGEDCARSAEIGGKLGSNT